jgi:hypothetical protein
MDLKTALRMISLEISWIEYSRRLAAAERDEEFLDEGCTPEEAVQVYTDPVYGWYGDRK